LAPRLSLADGFRAYFGGIGFVVGTPGLWGYAAVPVVVLAVLGTGLGALGVWGSAALSHAIVGDGGTAAEVGRWTLTALLAIVAFLVAFLIAFALAQPISGFALEAISQRQEKALAGAAPAPPKLAESFLPTLKVTLFGLVCTLPAIAVLTLIGIVFPPAVFVTVPIKFVIGALFIAWDLLDYPLGIRRLGVRDRLRFMTKNFGAVFAFGMSAGIFVLIPGFGLLMLPYGVAGATRLVVWDDKLLAQAPLPE
jgi:CysZ protein